MSRLVIGAGVHRFIMHSTFDPCLVKLTILNNKLISKDQKKAASKLKRNNWAEVDFDNGASFYYVKTRHGKEYSIPLDRLTLATFIATSP